MSAIPSLALALAAMAALLAAEALYLVRQLRRQQAATEYAVSILCKMAARQMTELEDEEKVEADKRVN